MNNIRNRLTCTGDGMLVVATQWVLLFSVLPVRLNNFITDVNIIECVFFCMIIVFFLLSFTKMDYVLSV